MWIQNLEEKIKHVPVFYKRFRVEKQLCKCLLKISALGIFNIKINGHEIEEYFMPGWTNYHQYVHLCHYDLTELIQEENLLEITLADGWYCGRLGYTKQANVYGTKTALFAELHLDYLDGTNSLILTDESWKVGNSKIVDSSFLDGETVDFSTPIHSLESLPYAKACEIELPFVKYDYEPVKQIDEISPVILFENENVVRLDFGQNFAGFISFCAQGVKGAELTVKFAEVLNEDGMLYFDNLRSAKVTDRLILSGKKDCFSPKFTFHGFRFAEIYLDGKTKISDLKGIVLSEDLDYHGKFECSDETVNAIFRNVVWGQKSNFISIPTDCPQRDERLGWTGDAQVFCGTAMFNSDCDRFFKNYLRLIQTDILPDGKIPSFAPFFIPVSVSTAGVPGWADAICVIPYTHYLHYHDESVIRENLPYAVKHLEYYLSRSEDYLLKLENPFGDWLSVKPAKDCDVISQCLFGLSASLISKMYAIVGNRLETEKYGKIFEETKRAFRAHYCKDNGEIEGNSQTVYALALSVGFVSKDEIKRSFVESLAVEDNRLTTGFIGVKYLLPALCEIGEVDLAYKIIKETRYPSWGYTIENGATTIWERWNGYTKENGFEDPGMNSFNHYSLGACVEWLYSHVLGIKLLEDRRICISPVFSKELSFARGEYKTPAGKIFVEWKYSKDAYQVSIEVEKGVVFDYNFAGREVLSVQKTDGGLQVVSKA